MKKFLKIVLFGILTLSLINISDTKINYLNNNNEVEKVRSPRKNANGNVSSWDQINTYEELNNVELISKDYDSNISWPHAENVPLISGYYPNDRSIEILQLYRIYPDGTEKRTEHFSNLSSNRLLTFNGKDILILGYYQEPGGSSN